VMARVHAESGAPAATAPPAKKWQPYGGYDPKNRGAPAADTSAGLLLHLNLLLLPLPLPLPLLLTMMRIKSNTV
jgi:hypothetical protein